MSRAVTVQEVETRSSIDICISSSFIFFLFSFAAVHFVHPFALVIVTVLVSVIMSVVSLLGVRVINNPATLLAPYEFEITFECLEQLQKGGIDSFLAAKGEGGI